MDSSAGTAQVERPALNGGSSAPHPMHLFHPPAAALPASKGITTLAGDCRAGKTTLLRALSSRSIKGMPATCQVLHVEQEAASSDMTVLEVGRTPKLVLALLGGGV